MMPRLSTDMCQLTVSLFRMHPSPPSFMEMLHHITGCRQSVSGRRKSCVCLSPPCPPWSFAANEKGINSPEGQTFLESLTAVKLIRPRIVIIEQVSGFYQHQHKPLIMQQMRWAGYSFTWGKLVDMEQICPTHRVRWLGMFTRITDVCIIKSPFQMWLPIGTHTPVSFDAVSLPRYVQ